MARYRGGIPAASALAAWAATSEPKKPKRASLRGMGDRQLVRLLEEATAMLASGEWARASAGHFVALYADLFFRVYGVEDSGLASADRAKARIAASRMLERDFAGDPSAMARFVSWTWTREKGREAFRRERGEGGGRLSWRVQFCGALLTDYRLAAARSASSGARPAVAE